MARSMVFLLLLAFVIAGCSSKDDGGDSDGTSTQTSTSGGASGSLSTSLSITGTGAPGSGVVQKTIMDDSFPNGDFTIQRGQSVNWTATSTSHPHSVSSDVAGVFDSSPGCTGATPNPCLHSGNTYEHKFDVAGTFPYHCNVHPTTMKGTITVTN